MRLAVFALVVLSTSLPSAAQEEARKSPPKMLQADGGRYVFGQLSDFRADQFMLDTKTGRLWQIVLVKDEKGGPDLKVLQVVPYTSISDGKWSLEPR